MPAHTLTSKEFDTVVEEAVNDQVWQDHGHGHGTYYSEPVLVNKDFIHQLLTPLIDRFSSGAPLALPADFPIPKAKPLHTALHATLTLLANDKATEIDIDVSLLSANKLLAANKRFPTHTLYQFILVWAQIHSKLGNIDVAKRTLDAYARFLLLESAAPFSQKIDELRKELKLQNAADEAYAEAELARTSFINEKAALAKADITKNYPPENYRYREHDPYFADAMASAAREAELRFMRNELPFDIFLAYTKAMACAAQCQPVDYLLLNKILKSLEHIQGYNAKCLVHKCVELFRRHSDSVKRRIAHEGMAADGMLDDYRRRVGKPFELPEDANFEFKPLEVLPPPALLPEDFNRCIRHSTPIPEYDIHHNLPKITDPNFLLNLLQKQRIVGIYLYAKILIRVLELTLWHDSKLTLQALTKLIPLVKFMPDQITPIVQQALPIFIRRSYSATADAKRETAPLLSLADFQTLLAEIVLFLPGKLTKELVQSQEYLGHTGPFIVSLALLKMKDYDSYQTAFRILDGLTPTLIPPTLTLEVAKSVEAYADTAFAPEEKEIAFKVRTRFIDNALTAVTHITEPKDQIAALLKLGKQIIRWGFAETKLEIILTQLTAFTAEAHKDKPYVAGAHLAIAELQQLDGNTETVIARYRVILELSPAENKGELPEAKAAKETTVARLAAMMHTAEPAKKLAASKILIAHYIQVLRKAPHKEYAHNELNPEAKEALAQLTSFIKVTDPKECDVQIRKEAYEQLYDLAVDEKFYDCRSDLPYHDATFAAFKAHPFIKQAFIKLHLALALQDVTPTPTDEKAASPTHYDKIALGFLTVAIEHGSHDVADLAYQALIKYSGSENRRHYSQYQPKHPGHPNEAFRKKALECVQRFELDKAIIYCMAYSYDIRCIQSFADAKEVAPSIRIKAALFMAKEARIDSDRKPITTAKQVEYNHLVLSLDPINIKALTGLKDLSDSSKCIPEREYILCKFLLVALAGPRADAAGITDQAEKDRILAAHREWKGVINPTGLFTGFGQAIVSKVKGADLTAFEHAKVYNEILIKWFKTSRDNSTLADFVFTELKAYEALDTPRLDDSYAGNPARLAIVKNMLEHINKLLPTANVSLPSPPTSDIKAEGLVKPAPAAPTTVTATVINVAEGKSDGKAKTMAQAAAVDDVDEADEAEPPTLMASFPTEGTKDFLPQLVVLLRQPPVVGDNPHESKTDVSTRAQTLLLAKLQAKEECHATWVAIAKQDEVLEQRAYLHSLFKEWDHARQQLVTETIDSSGKRVVRDPTSPCFQKLLDFAKDAKRVTGVRHEAWRKIKAIVADEPPEDCHLTPDDIAADRKASFANTEPVKILTFNCSDYPLWKDYSSSSAMALFTAFHVIVVSSKLSHEARAFLQRAAKDSASSGNAAAQAKFWLQLLEPAADGCSKLQQFIQKSEIPPPGSLWPHFINYFVTRELHATGNEPLITAIKAVLTKPAPAAKAEAPALFEKSPSSRHFAPAGKQPAMAMRPLARNKAPLHTPGVSMHAHAGTPTVASAGRPATRPAAPSPGHTPYASPQ